MQVGGTTPDNVNVTSVSAASSSGDSSDSASTSSSTGDPSAGGRRLLAASLLGDLFTGWAPALAPAACFLLSRVALGACPTKVDRHDGLGHPGILHSDSMSVTT